VAIQEVEKREAEGTAGKRRKINEAAEGMVMDIVQAQQYTKPIESTVRELTANAVDSQSEKERAIEILSGQATPDKYFIERDGALYADSKWDPDYYNLDHLNKNSNEVELIYEEGEGGGRCDRFIVRDHGVGIGGRRLEGVLEIGFSTKRNRKDALGAFGLGAKVGLATGADYYTLTTVYNGVKFEVQVYNRKVVSTIGPLNLETGEANVPYEFSDGFTIYGEKTNEKNFSQVSVAVLKHHKSSYIQAVKTQLLYFNNVKFIVGQTAVDFKAQTLYNSENLIISTNSPYSKPHVVIVKGGDDVEHQTGVCYGHIDFQEMELEDMSGDIGIKCPIRQVIEDDEGNEIVINEGVDVVPSREAVRWTAATREFLRKQFGAAQEEASNLVEKELKETDFLLWLQACKNIAYSSSGENTTIGRLAQIVDLKSVTPKFAKTKIRFGSLGAVFSEFNVTVNTKFFDKKENKYKVERTSAKTWHEINLDALYIKHGNAGRHTDVYLADQHGEQFFTVSPKTKESFEHVATEKVRQGKMAFTATAKWVEGRMERQAEILSMSQESTEYRCYDDIEVPEDYLKNLQKVETGAEEIEEEKAPELSAKERRELEQRVVCNTLVEREIPYHEEPNQKTWIGNKREPKFQEIKDYTGTLYYGFQKDESKVHFAAHIMQQLVKNQVNEDHPDLTHNPRKRMWFDNERYKLLLVSKSNTKHFAMHNHIDDFFGKPELNYG